MLIFIVTSNYFPHNYFGIYSTIKYARIALEDFLVSDENITAFEDLGDYCYQFTTANGETFGAEIVWDTIDTEFEEE